MGRGQLAAQKILTPAREDDPRDKTQLSFMHDSSSSSEEKPQEGLDHCIICIYKLGCHPPICHKWGCCSKEGAENSTRVEPSNTKEPQESLDHCKRCIYQLGCHPPICHKWGCCRKEGAENSTSVELSNTKENGADEVMKLYVKIKAKPEGENGEERERMESLSASQHVLLFYVYQSKDPLVLCCSGSVYCNYPFCSCV